MSLLKSRNKKITREMVGARNIYSNGVLTTKNEFILYFLVKPFNVTVLSEVTVKSKITNLMNVLKDVDSIELACVDGRENFEENKLYLEQRLAEEKNAKVREILEKDYAFLDRIQIQTASAREFMFIVKLRNKELKDTEIKNTITKIEKLIKEQGFTVSLANKEDIKRLFAVYYVQNITQVYFDDFDGESFGIVRDY